MLLPPTSISSKPDSGRCCGKIHYDLSVIFNPREEHIGERHPELLPQIRERIRMTLAEPHEVRRSARSFQLRASRPCRPHPWSHCEISERPPGWTACGPGY